MPPRAPLAQTYSEPPYPNDPEGALGGNHFPRILPFYRLYVELLGEHCRARGIAVWAWCLMPNHVHLILVPPSAEAMTTAIADTHCRYSFAVNRRQGWRGNPWQGRFGYCAMDEPHTLSALRYVERNTDRARLVARPEDWPWSSARAHLGIADDTLVQPRALDELIPDWRRFLHDDPPNWQLDVLREHVRTGRPFGTPAFVADLERQVGRQLAPAKRGRGRKETIGSAVRYLSLERQFQNS